MSSAILSIGPEDPAYYADLLKGTASLVERHLPFDERSCPTVPEVDKLTRHLQTLLDDIASISLCEKRNVSATMAFLKNDNDTLNTRLYIIFNHQNDNAHTLCRQHLGSIFKMLRQVPHKSPEVDGSPQLIMSGFETDFLEICQTIHNYSFSVFAHHVTKHQDQMSNIRSHIAGGEQAFAPMEYPILLEFLEHVQMIIKIVEEAQATKQLFTDDIRVLLLIYSYWMQNGLLPQDPLADNPFTLLDTADRFLAGKGVRFQLRRWAMKIMSFMITTNRLFTLTQSRRLRKLLDGTFDVQVLSSPAVTPYRCDLSHKTVQKALDAVLPETSDLDENRQLFITTRSKVSSVTHLKPKVHAELAMIITMAERNTERLGYIGVSKLSCIMCTHYIRAFRKVTGVTVSTRGSHGKAYPGWVWPHHPDSDCNKTLCQAFLTAIREQLRRDFEQGLVCRKSDSRVGSDGPRLDIKPTRDEISQAFKGRISRLNTDSNG